MNGADRSCTQDQRDRMSKGHMSYDDYAQELAHLRAMILQVERLIHDHDAGQGTPVTSSDYWRARVNALREADLPRPLELQARALLARLDALRAASRPRA